MGKFDLIKNKIVKPEEINHLKAYWKFKGFTVVFTNGCFDILHRGHVEYLLKAADLGNILIIGLNSDQSVRRIKGKNRPVQDETSRSLILASLQFVNYIILFDEDTPYNLIKSVEPHILVKGADYKKEEIVGHDIVENYGGKVVTIDLVEGYSSSSIIRKM